MKIDTSDRAYTANYPHLHNWLEKHEGRCMWQQAHGMKHNPDYIECWLVNGQPFIVTVHANKRGWEIFTSTNTNDAAATFEDAEKRLGLRAMSTWTTEEWIKSARPSNQYNEIEVERVRAVWDAAFAVSIVGQIHADPQYANERLAKKIADHAVKLYVELK